MAIPAVMVPHLRRHGFEHEYLLSDSRDTRCVRVHAWAAHRLKDTRPEAAEVILAADRNRFSFFQDVVKVAARNLVVLHSLLLVPRSPCMYTQGKGG